MMMDASGCSLPDLHHGLDAVHAARHFQIDEVDGVVARPAPSPAPRAPEAAVSTQIAVLPQPGGQRFAHHFFVVDYQDLPVGLHVVCDSLEPRSRRAAQAAQYAACFRSICRMPVESDMAQPRSAQCTSPNRWPDSCSTSLQRPFEQDSADRAAARRIPGAGAPARPRRPGRPTAPARRQTSAPG